MPRLDPHDLAAGRDVVVTVGAVLEGVIMKLDREAAPMVVFRHNDNNTTIFSIPNLVRLRRRTDDDIRRGT